jgi:hypothetical protein
MTERSVLAASSAPGAGSGWPVAQVLRSGRPLTLDRVADGLDPVTTVVPAPKPVGRQPLEERPRSPRERQDQA